MPKIIKQSMEELAVVHAELQEVKKSLKPNQKVIVIMDTETTGLAYDNYELQTQQKRMPHNPQQYLDKMIEVGAIYAIEETHEDGNKEIVPIQSLRSGVDLGFRMFFNPWLDNVESFPKEMPKESYNVHKVSVEFLAGDAEIQEFDEILEAPAPSAHQIVKDPDGNDVSYIEKVMDLFNEADSMVAHNINFDINVINATVKDHNSLLRKANASDLNKRISPLNKEISAIESSIQELKVLDQTPDIKDELEKLDEALVLISQQIKTESTPKQISYFTGKLVDTLAIFRKELPSAKQMAIQGLSKSKPINHKLDTGMAISGQEEREIHGAYEDSRLLLEFLKHLTIEYTNKTDQINTAKKLIDYTANYNLVRNNEPTVESTATQEKNLVSSSFTIDNPNKAASCNDVPRSDIKTHLTTQLQKYDAVVSNKATTKDNINSSRISPDSPNYALESHVDDSILYLENFIFKNLDKVKNLSEMESKLAKHNIPSKYKESVKPNLIKAGFNYMKHQLDSNFNSSLLSQADKIQTRIDQTTNQVAASTRQTHHYFHGHRSVPSSKKSEEVSVVGSILDVKKLLEECRDDGISEITYSDFNTMSGWYNDQKYIKGYNEENPDNQIKVNYGITTLVEIDGDYSQINFTAKTEQHLHNISKILTKASNNSSSDPHLKLSDLTEDLVGDLFMSQGGFNGLVEMSLEKSSNPQEGMDKLINKAERIIEATGEINIEFYKSDVLLHDYKSEFISRLKENNPNAKINQIFANEITHLKGKDEMHLFRSKSLVGENFIEQSDGTTTLMNVENINNNNFMTLSTNDYSLPNNPPKLPDFIGDLEFTRKHSPEVYAVLENSSFYKEDFLADYLPITAKHLKENKHYTQSKNSGGDLSGGKYDLENNDIDNTKSIQIDYFIRESMAGLKDRAERLELTKEEKKVYYQRLDYELSIMISMDFPGYHLLVKDFLDTLTNKIGGNKGPGRGSAAGSLVCYSLGITNTDPIEHGLIFERYLNPERVSLPDIDMDMHGNISIAKLLKKDGLSKDFLSMVEHEYGEDLKKSPDFTAPAKSLLELHEKSKYGADSVLNLLTVGTLKPKSSIDLICKELGSDFAKSCGLPLMSGGTPYIEMAKAIKGTFFDHPGTTLEDVMAGEGPETEQFMDMYNSNSAVKFIVDLATELEGTASHFGTHAAGVVIVNALEGLLGKAVSIIGGKYVTSIDGKNVEDQLGIKFDFLGLEALTIIEDTLGIIGATKSDDKESEVRGVLDVEKDIYSDRKIYEQMKSGNSYEIFQFSSDLMKSLTTQILPDNMDSIPDDKVKDMFYDLVAATALGRPGADSDLYIENKNNPENIEYLFPELENILSETKGVPVYQEQIMEMVKSVAGFSLGEADLMRRAMGKKILSEMEAMESQFVEGAIKSHPQESADQVTEKAKELWQFIVKFAGYGFNKSHAVAYTLVSMQQAYLKFNYPEQYFTSLLRNKSGDIEKLTEIIVDAKKNGMELKECDINKSMKNFEFRGESIRYGLDVIKGTSSTDVDAILIERKSNGEYKTIGDFIGRLMNDPVNISVRTVKGLIWSGALDNLDLSDLLKYISPLPELKDFIELNKDKFNSKSLQKHEIRSILMKSLLTINDPSAKGKKKIDMESDYDQLNTILGSSMVELDKTGSYCSIGSPLANQDVTDNLSPESDNVTALDMNATPFDRSQKLSSLAVVSSVSSGNSDGNEYAYIDIMDINGFSKRVHLLESQAISYNKKSNIEPGDVIEIDLDVDVNSNGYANVKPGNIFVFKEADSWSKQASIEKDRFSIKDIDAKKTKLKNFETEQIQSDWKNMESNGNNGEYVLIQKGYREIETKAGKQMYIFELTDGISGRVMEFVHFNPLNNALLDANNGLPIKIKLGKYNPAYGMSSAFKAQPTPLGISALTNKAMDRESEFIESKSDSHGTSFKKPITQETIDGVKYPLSFSTKTAEGTKKFKRSPRRNILESDDKKCALYVSDDKVTKIWINKVDAESALVYFHQKATGSKKNYKIAKQNEKSGISLHGFSDDDKDNILENLEPVKSIYGNFIYTYKNTVSEIVEFLEKEGFSNSTDMDVVALSSPREIIMMAPFEYPSDVVRKADDAQSNISNQKK